MKAQFSLRVPRLASEPPKISVKRTAIGRSVSTLLAVRGVREVSRSSSPEW